MDNHITDYDARQEAKWQGERVEQRKQRLLDWCITPEHANRMYEELQRRLDRHRQERRDAEASIADELETLNAVKRMMYEEGWRYD